MSMIDDRASGKLPPDSFTKASAWIVMARLSAPDGFVRLQDADWKFASAALKEEYWELEDQPAPKRRSPNFTNVAEGVKAISETISEGVSYAFRKGPPIEKMREYVTEKLRRGELEARGVKIKPRRGEGLETIPAYYFDHPKISWRRNIVENFGDCFAAVEVRRVKKETPTVKEQSVSGQLIPQREKALTEKKMGRPSAENEITAAIAALDSKGFDFKVELKVSYEAILKQLGKSSGDKGYSDPVLHRCLKRYLSQKSSSQFRKFLNHSEI